MPAGRCRATKVGGREVPLDSYALFSNGDLLTQVTLERMLAGVATRRHTPVAEPIGDDLEEVATGDSRSAVSRHFVGTMKLERFFAFIVKGELVDQVAFTDFYKTSEIPARSGVPRSRSSTPLGSDRTVR